MIYFPLAFAKNLGVDFDLSTYARQPAGGAYVGPSCATLAYVGLMLSQKIRKTRTAKNIVKRRNHLMVGGLSWGYVGLS